MSTRNVRRANKNRVDKATTRGLEIYQDDTDGELYYKDINGKALKIIAGALPPGTQGIQGIQGVQGVQGTAGTVGPAGLTWQGTWVSGTSYSPDDAVGFDGASYYCVIATSGIVDPATDTTNWALLASQGANGVQGVQGIQGIQGPAGPIGYTVYIAEIVTSSGGVTVTQFENTIGDGSGDGINDIAWTDATSHGVNGELRGTMTSGNPFPVGKIWSMTPNMQDVYTYSVKRSSNNPALNRMTIFIKDSGGSPVNPYTTVWVEIKVYP